MEAIFEALLSIIFEFVIEIVSEIVEAILEIIIEEFIHSILSGDFLTSINRHMPDSFSISNEITTLGISDYKKEIFDGRRF